VVSLSKSAECREEDIIERRSQPDCRDLGTELKEEVSEIPMLAIRLNRASHYPPTVERSVTTAKRNITLEGELSQFHGRDMGLRRDKSMIWERNNVSGWARCQNYCLK
jgi:hypothetical protein